MISKVNSNFLSSSSLEQCEYTNDFSFCNDKNELQIE